MSRARILADYVSSGDELADKAPIASPTFTGTVAGVTATHVGLGNVTNESKATMLATSTLTGVTTAASLVLTPGSAPATTEGAMYYDSTDDVVYVRSASSWDKVKQETFKLGGTINKSGGYTYHTFTSSENFVVSGAATTMDFFIVAGGGSGGPRHGGGGGAGGYRTFTSVSVGPGSLPVVVGAGGAAVSGSLDWGREGGVSSFNGNTSAGGGGGANDGAGNYDDENDGGSGGGSSYDDDRGENGNTPSTSPAQGHRGGNGYASGEYSGGGGGGAGADGADGSSGTGGNGGVGSNAHAAWITAIAAGGGATYGHSGYFAGGGGGSPHAGATGGTGGTGGGGNGTKNSGGDSGTANTGGGGGADGHSNTSGAGGSGIVIIRYAT